MHLPRFLRRVNRVFTNPMLGTLAWLVPPLAVVHHRGRKSGRTYRSPVVAFQDHDGVVVIPMTYGRDTDWARNLISAGGGEVERMGKRIVGHHPRIVDLADALPHLPAALRGFFRVADFPGFLLLDS